MPFSAFHILIAEDDEVLIDLLSAVLIEQGFSVATARDSDEALKAISLKQPSVIILDIMLPGLSGFDLLRKLKANQFHTTIPVLMLSSRASEREQVQAFDFGAADFIAKPFRVEDLIVRIKRLISRQGLEEA